MSHRIGIYGGMFDPVHRGHMQVASHAIEILELSNLVMVPCHNPNHRDAATASSEQRLRMLELATKAQSKIEISDFELQRPEKSYTLSTLKHFRENDPDAELVFVMGMDSFTNLTQWYKWAELFSVCHFLVVSRPGFDLALPGNEFSQIARIVKNADEMFCCDAGNVLISQSLNFDHASSELRQLFNLDFDVSGSAKQLTNYVPVGVAEFIINENLYSKSKQ